MNHNPTELTELRDMRARAMAAGGQEARRRPARQGQADGPRAAGALLDEGTFQEIGALATHNVSDFGMADKKFPGDGVVAGFGKIRGRKVAVYAQDFTVLGGSFSEVQSHKICRIMDVAVDSGIPIVALIDSGGARIQEGVRSLAAYGELFTRNVHGLRRRAADRRHPRPQRGRRGLLAGADGLRAHGAPDQPHVHHRPRRDQDRHRRGRHLPRPGRHAGA